MNTLAIATIALLGSSVFRAPGSNLVECQQQKKSESAFPHLKPHSFSTRSCNAQQVGDDASKIVCICSEQQRCGELSVNWPQKQGQATLIGSSLAGLRFHQTNLDAITKVLEPLPLLTKQTTISIDLQKQYQPILGWGGAFTDSTGHNLNNLSPKLARQLVDSYYGQNGLRYNFGRVPIGGSDFSTRAYSYDDSEEPDYELKRWALAEEDMKLKIPYMKLALDIAANNTDSSSSSSSSSKSINFFSTPYSPPRWMKTNDDFVRGRLIDEDRVYKSYAEYLMKFFDAYAANGIKFWGATVQNEPVFSNWPLYSFNSLQMDGPQMAKFIGKYLGPALEARNMTTRTNAAHRSQPESSFKLMIGDDSLGFVNRHVLEVLADPEAQKYISGLAFHWYASGGEFPFDSLTELYLAVKDKIGFVMMTEACVGNEKRENMVDLGSWERGQRYAEDIIEDLNRNTNAWIDLNMALDLKGGPNWAKNFVDSPIIVNADRNEFYKQPMYHVLGHFSRLFRPASIRVGCLVESGPNPFTPAEPIIASAVHNIETGHLIVNILNKSEDKRKIKLSLEEASSQSNSPPQPPMNQPANNKTHNNNKQRNIDTFIVDGKSITSVLVKL